MGFLSKIFGGGSKPPPAPDYTAAAKLQADSSAATTAAQTAANRPNMTTPWGSQTWSSTQGIDPATGKPVTNWASEIKLTPEQQAALDSQQRLQMGQSQAAEGLLGQATESFQQPFDWQGMPQRAGAVAGSPLQLSLSQTPGQWRQTAQSAVEELQRPGLQMQRGLEESAASNMGISRGSDAWRNAQRDIGDRESRAGLMAIAAGRDEANQLFGQDLSAGQFANTARGQQLGMDMSAGGFNNTNRQQAIAEQMQQRAMPLNELNALITGQQVQSPNMPSFTNASKSDPTNYLGAAGQQYQGQLDAYNAKQAGKSGLMSGLFGLGSAAMGAGGWGSLFNLG